MAARMWGLPHPPPVGADCCPLHPSVSHAAPCPLGRGGEGNTQRGDWRWVVGRALGLRESHCEWQPHSCCCTETGPVPQSPLRSPWSLSSREDLEAHGFRVQVGRLRLYDHDKLIKVTQIVRHPKFNQSLSAQGGADIALLKLETPVTLSRLVSLVALPPTSLKVPERKMCWVTGWGYIRLGGKLRETWRGVWRCRAARWRCGCGFADNTLLSAIWGNPLPFYCS